MINADMQEYSYYLYADDNGYGQPSLSDDPQGTVKMAIYPTTTAIQDNINYSGANYMGFTYDDITDKAVIDYEGKKLKVLYIIKASKRIHTQVFMGAM